MCFLLNRREDCLIKKILVVTGGGPPERNTGQLVDAFVKGAEEAGHSVEKVSLLKTEVKGCAGCNACRYGKPCVQKDGFNELVPKIKGGRIRPCLRHPCIFGRYLLS